MSAPIFPPDILDQAAKLYGFVCMPDPVSLSPRQMEIIERFAKQLTDIKVMTAKMRNLEKFVAERGLWSEYVDKVWPASGKTEIVDASTPVEWWRPTNALRWTSKGLEQGWVNNRGDIDWRLVPMEKIGG